MKKAEKEKPRCITRICKTMTQIAAPRKKYRTRKLDAPQSGGLQVILQRQRSRDYRDARYYRYRVTIPVSAIRLMGWKGGEKLGITCSGESITIMKLQDDAAMRH